MLRKIINYGKVWKRLENNLVIYNWIGGHRFPHHQSPHHQHQSPHHQQTQPLPHPIIVHL